MQGEGATRELFFGFFFAKTALKRGLRTPKETYWHASALALSVSWSRRCICSPQGVEWNLGWKTERMCTMIWLNCAAGAHRGATSRSWVKLRNLVWKTERMCTIIWLNCAAGAHRGATSRSWVKLRNVVWKTERMCTIIFTQLCSGSSSRRYLKDYRGSLFAISMVARCWKSPAKRPKKFKRGPIRDSKGHL